jgi:hypothetical protein
MHPIKLRHVAAVVAVMFCFFTVSALPASAVAAKFHSTTSSVNNDGSLTVSFDERGLGEGNIDYILTAHVDATFACINGGGKNPSAANKRTISSEVSTTGSFESKNGRVVASLTTSAPSAGDFTCPNGQRLVLASASYTNIVLTDTTNGSSTTVDDASRVFFNV